MKKITSHLGAIILSSGMLVSGSSFAQEAVNIATSGSGSPFYQNAVGISRVIQNHTAINATVESGAGSTPNIFSIMSGEADMAVVNALAAISGYDATPPFTSQVDLRIIAQGGLSLRQVFVRRGANISSVKDLEGKTWIHAMPANPDILQISEALASVAELNTRGMRLASMTTSREAIDGFSARTIDAVTMPASAGAPLVAQLFESRTIDYLPIDEATASALQELLPRGLNVGILPAGTYPNQAEDAVVFELRTLLVAHANTPDDVVYEIAKAMFENREELSSYHASARGWTVANTVNNPDLPLHPGTIRYLQEIGEWTPAMEARQASF